MGDARVGMNGWFALTRRAAIAAVTIAASVASAIAEPTTPAASTAPAASAAPVLNLELNKLEANASGCRAYMVIQNDGQTALQALKLDLVLFQTDGIIGRRFAIDLGQIKAQKRSVKLFDIADLACDKIGSLLINDVVECKADTGPLSDCLSGMTVKSLGNVQLSK